MILAIVDPVAPEHADSHPDTIGMRSEHSLFALGHLSTRGLVAGAPAGS